MTASLLSIPSFLRSAINSSRSITSTGTDINSESIDNGQSYIYDSLSCPLKNTNQLNIDWSKFENHTFFTPATINVNSAFDTIINNYPFDGSALEYEKFIKNMSGFNFWILSQFPKYQGQLLFESSKSSYISVVDSSGALFPELIKSTSSKNSKGIIAPEGGEDLTLEMWLYCPAASNQEQVVCQKVYSGTLGQVGFSLLIDKDVSTTTTQMIFSMSSGSYSLRVDNTLNKGEFNHIVAEFNNDGEQWLSLSINDKSIDSAHSTSQINSLQSAQTNFYIGSGSSITNSLLSFTPKTTFDGVLDEFRVFKSIRTATNITFNATRSIFSTSDLALYFKFNEPPPPLVPDLSDPINAIVLDSSGNSLHSLIMNFSDTMRIESTSSPYGNPVNLEDSSVCPILFPNQIDVVSLNTSLLSSASLYDSNNPNIITKLIPEHYLFEGQIQDGLETEDGTIISTYTGASIPGTGKLGTSQLFMSLLVIYARFFDELKMYVDAFSTVQYVDYDKTDTCPDTFLQRLLTNHWGFSIPSLFSHSNIEQYVSGRNVSYDLSQSQHSLKYVQGELLRRILINVPTIVKSKGTQHSIKSFLRSLGIDPENSCRIKEYGGPTRNTLGSSRESKTEFGGMINFPTNTAIIISPFLSASRIETGFPKQSGLMVLKNEYPPHGISNNVNDGLLTSGSWTVETTIKFPPNTTTIPRKDSVIRLCTSGSSPMSTGLVANLTLDEESSTSTVFIRNGDDNADNIISLTVSGSIYDGDHWYLSFGRFRNDEINTLSSSYFLRLGKPNNGVANYTSTEMFSSTIGKDVFEQLIPNLNIGGIFLASGPNQILHAGSTSSYRFLNNVVKSPESNSRLTSMLGEVSNVRFWSRALTITEWIEHVKNFKSVGTLNPTIEYNFTSVPTGSFGKLRLDSVQKQTITSSNISGQIELTDFSCNNFHLMGSGFAPSSPVVIPSLFQYSHISPLYDEPITDQKVRPRSFSDIKFIEQFPGSNFAPYYEIDPSENTTDSLKLSVEFSLIDALNRDIVNIFSSFDYFDDALGKPEMLFSPDFPELENIRDVYFNRLSGKLNFKAFHEFYKFFDASLDSFIDMIVPKKTHFMGVNYVVEPHILERAKLQYHFEQIYLGDGERKNLNQALLLQQITGIVVKY